MGTFLSDIWKDVELDFQQNNNSKGLALVASTDPLPTKYLALALPHPAIFPTASLQSGSLQAPPAMPQ